MTAQWLGNSYAVTVKKTATPVLLWFHSYIGLACVMLSCLGEMVATVGFLRREPQDCNQSLCQKRAPWAPLRLIQPNNKQQITALACRQEQSPRGLRAGETGVFCLSPACAETSPRFEGRIGRFMWRAEFFTPSSVTSKHISGVLIGNVCDQLRNRHFVSLLVIFSISPNDCK